MLCSTLLCIEILPASVDFTCRKTKRRVVFLQHSFWRRATPLLLFFLLSFLLPHFIALSSIRQYSSSPSSTSRWYYTWRFEFPGAAQPSPAAPAALHQSQSSWKHWHWRYFALFLFTYYFVPCIHSRDETRKRDEARSFYSCVYTSSLGVIHLLLLHLGSFSFPGW